MHSDEIGSPGLGTTPGLLSRLPLATEGEATEGPDDELNIEELETADIGAPALTVAPDMNEPSFDFGLPWGDG